MFADAFKAEAAPAGASASSAASAVSAASAPTASAGPRSALVVVIIGMAGSGKTTFVTGLQRHLREVCGKRVYTLNLDPAVVSLAYAPNIDIRDTVDYKKVMQHYRLGPNGAILTSLNLFATKFGDVLQLLEQRRHTHDVILVDTPGQIEVFTWSASGAIILESLSATLPTCVCYVLDTPRCTRPITLMSNMLYACSVLYKAKLPFVGCFNKTDVAHHAVCQEWMTDYDAFQEALLTDDSYLASLSRSSALMLVEFYRVIQTVGVSSTTGQGMSDMVKQLERCAEEYQTDFLPFFEQQKKAKEERQRESATQEFAQFKRDYDPAVKAAALAAAVASSAVSAQTRSNGAPEARETGPMHPAAPDNSAHAASSKAGEEGLKREANSDSRSAFGGIVHAGDRRPAEGGVRQPRRMPKLLFAFNTFVNIYDRLSPKCA
ncbi:putative ATP binding protein [Besnoitia besnoiti]|uniref:GPN-loop GTPase n=1 Tax=Besnoitia besnoiti TaxID=94643 RepID=A0A2A9MAC2_BESBE|nr:putative ATP binding protein [Besnoitia besnoiti]PFH34849.1 putative ATP binding protein [Besnoitia besnoiti]